MRPKVVVIDHKDSFAFILGDQFAARGADVETVRADVDPQGLGAWIDAQRPALVVLSPGPGGPDDCPATTAWLRSDPAVPVLGVCLGMQAMAAAGGGRVARMARPVHGCATAVGWSLAASGADRPEASVALGAAAKPLARAVAEALSPRQRVARYHSLAVVDPGPEHLVLAETEVREDPVGRAIAMAMVHRHHPRLGLQFHPESVLTPCGGHLIGSILDVAMTQVGLEP